MELVDKLYYRQRWHAEKICENEKIVQYKIVLLVRIKGIENNLGA